MSDVIIEWNCTKIYDRGDNNCQHFIDDILKHLGIALNFGESVSKFLNKIRTKGSCSIKYHIPPQIQEKLKLKEKKITFATHQQLDEFVNSVIEKVPAFQMEFKDDWYLLKSFDRAFWLRHYKSEATVAYKPSQVGCPMGDPKETSLCKDWF